MKAWKSWHVFLVLPAEIKETLSCLLQLLLCSWEENKAAAEVSWRKSVQDYAYLWF